MLDTWKWTWEFLVLRWCAPRFARLRTATHRKLRAAHYASSSECVAIGHTDRCRCGGTVLEWFCRTVLRYPTETKFPSGSSRSARAAAVPGAGNAWLPSCIPEVSKPWRNIRWQEVSVQLLKDQRWLGIATRPR
ncbi:protein of unknown function [Paraburkholderia kururiensis]